MPVDIMNYTVDLEETTLVIRCVKAFTYTNALEVLEPIRTSPAYTGAEQVLIIDTESTFNASVKEMQKLSAIFIGLLKERSGRIALVVSSPHHFGFGRMTEALADSGPGIFRVFTAEDAARRWFGAEETQVRT
jgi:hypothetical protein